MGNLKAMFLSLATLFIILPILAVLILVHNSAIDTDSRIAEFTLQDRNAQLGQSIGLGFKNLLTSELGLNITTNQTRIRITENMSSKDIGEISDITSLRAYSSFVESNFNNSPSINISDYILDRVENELRILVKPYFSVYKHNPSDNKIIWIPEKHEHIMKCGALCNLVGYKISIQVDEQAPVGEIIQAPSSCTGEDCLSVDIDVFDALGILMEHDNMVVDADSESSATISFDSLDNAIEIKIENPAMLTITELDTSVELDFVYLDIVFDNSYFPNELLYATFDENFININFLELDIRVGTSTILSNDI